MSIIEEINKIITTDPYSYKFLLEDNEDTEQRIRDLEDQKKEYDDYKKELEAVLNDLAGE